MGEQTANGVSHGLRLALGLIAWLVSQSSFAGQLSCYEEHGTRATTCIDEHKVHAHGDVRSSAMYKGGPKGVQPTDYTIVVDCKLRIATLQDAQGVNFGAGPTNATKALSALSQWVCDAAKPIPDKTLQQFGGK